MARMSDPEPVLWTLFGAGGMVNAFFVPAHLLVFGLLLPLGLLPAGVLSHGSLLSLVQHPLGKLYLLVLVPLPMFHFAHRFRFTLMELGLRQMDTIIAVVLYGGAALTSVAAAAIILGI